MSSPAMAVDKPKHQDEDDYILEVSNLKKYFPISAGIVFQRQVGAVRAVDGISFNVVRGETLGLVGESGCGKSTTGRTILQLYRPTEGSVKFEGQELSTMTGNDSAADAPPDADHLSGSLCLPEPAYDGRQHRQRAPANPQDVRQQEGTATVCGTVAGEGGLESLFHQPLSA